MIAKDEPKSFDQKRRAGRGEFRVTCYKCGEEGHRAYECPQKVGDRRAIVVNEVKDSVIKPKQGESTIW